MSSLSYKVYCQSAYIYFELIAAFDCEQAAIAYAKECASANARFQYRVLKGQKMLRIPALEKRA